MEETKEKKWLAEVLAEFLVNTKFNDLPQETVKAVKEFVLDVIPSRRIVKSC